MDFDAEEMDRLRQWFNAMDDMVPGYVEDEDRMLMSKIMAALGRGEQWERHERWRKNNAKVKAGR
jgi:hypothetical protein